MKGAWSVQAEITRDDKLIDRRLLLQVLQHCFKCDMVAVNV